MIKREGMKVYASTNIFFVGLEGFFLGEAVRAKPSCWVSRLGYLPGAERPLVLFCGQGSDVRLVFTLCHEHAALVRFHELGDGLLAKVGS